MEYNITQESKGIRIKIEMKDGGKIIGWAFLYVIAQDRHKEPYGLMENVYIEPEYRGKGLGIKLVELLIEEAKKQQCYKIIGTSKHHKTNVHAFYTKLGFKNIGIKFRMDLISDSKILTKD